LKYGAKRSNPDGSISLLAHHIEFVHPVSKQTLSFDSPLPDEPLWQAMGAGVIHNA
jgi:23S rRNA pseudouridine1911/1915/1917 synthase